MTDRKEVKISAKNLAALLMPDACPKCFWIKHHMKVPYSIFPGIFMSIDAFTKKAMHAYFDQHGKMPPWVTELSMVTGYLKAPHHTKFRRFDPATGITLSGGVDDYFETVDEAHVIPDYKTARFTKNQDKLLPIYHGQLNGYRWIDEGLGHEVHSTPLIYFEPVTAVEDATPDIFHGSGFHMKFAAKTMQIEKEDDLIPSLLAQAAEIIFLDKPPAAVDECSDCTKLNLLSDLR